MSTPLVCSIPLEDRQRGRGKVRDAAITLAHGSGGKAMRDLIQDVILGAFNNPLLAPLEDQAVVSKPDSHARNRPCSGKGTPAHRFDSQSGWIALHQRLEPGASAIRLRPAEKRPPIACLALECKCPPTGKSPAC
jgi:hypothetical protein